MAPSRDHALIPSLEDFRADSLRGTPGFFRIGQTTTGQWWLLDPLGHAFFCKAVAGVNRSGRIGSRLPASPSYFAQPVDTPLDHESHLFLRTAIQHLRTWHFNALGAWAEPSLSDQGIYYTEVLGLGRCGPLIRTGDALLPDVFDPAWREAAERLAREHCAPHRGSRELIGYFTDHALGWAQPRTESSTTSAQPAPKASPSAPPPPPARPSLLQLCLSLEPSFRAYHAAWEFVLATRRGDLATLAQDWEITLPNKESLRQLTHDEIPLLSAGYLRDQQIFSREFARRYFATCASVIRAHAPEHLILGCRFSTPPGTAILAECVYPNVDALSVRPEADTWEKSAQSCHVTRTMPVLLIDAHWTGDDFLHTPQRGEPRGCTPLERMLKKARAVFGRICAHRAIIGYEWAAWIDTDFDRPPFGRGLMHAHDREAREHTDLLTDLNHRAERLRMHGR